MSWHDAETAAAGFLLANLLWIYIYRRFLTQVEGLTQSLRFWKDRHQQLATDAAASEAALVELLVNRLDYPPQAAREALRVWRQNGWGRARIGGAEISDMRD